MFLRWNFKSLSGFLQHFLGEAAVILPEMYRHSFVAQGELEPILRICLLDPSFHAFVEKVEGELRKLLEEWRIATTAEGRKVKLVQCVFSYTVRVGCAWWWWGNVSCYSADGVLNTIVLKSLCYIAWRECCELSWIKVVRGGTHKIKRKKKTWFIFKLFIQKKNIGLTQMFDRGYILWSLCYHLNAGPFPPWHTWIHDIEMGGMQLQQWLLQCQLPSDPTILKLHSVKQTALHTSI